MWKERLAVELAKQCFSVYEGCACHLEKGHAGLHECAGRDVCGQEPWTTEQAQAWAEGGYR